MSVFETNPRCEDFPEVIHGYAKHVARDNRTTTDKQPPFELNEATVVHCDSGYGLRTIVRSVCERSADDPTVAAWNPPSTACFAKSCPAPPDLENGRYKGRLFAFPYSVSYSCDPGYVLNGLATYYCTTRGIWEPAVRSLRCDPVRCPDLAWDDPNGTLEMPPNGAAFAGAEVKYACQEGFRIVHPLLKNLRFVSKICGLDGKWASEGDAATPPVCERVVCPPIPDHPSILEVREPDDRNENSIAVVRCRDGRDVLLKCLMNGRWTGERPYCYGEETTTKEKKNIPEVKKVKKRKSEGRLFLWILAFALLLLLIIFRLVY